MITPLRRRLRLARRGVLYALAAMLVSVALLTGAVSRLLPLAERHPDRVAAWLTERAGRPVGFDRLETSWTRRGPLLRFDGLRIGEGPGAVRIGEAEMLVSQYAGLLPGRAFTELRLRGLQLTLERAADGRWQVRGLPGGERDTGDPFAVLERLGELQVIGGRLTVDAPALGLDVTLPRIDLRLQVDGDRLRAGARAWIDEAAQPLDLALDLDRHDGDGQAYAAAMRADVGAWAPLLRFAGARVESGSGRAQLWLRLRGKRVSQVNLEAALAGVGVSGAPLPGQAQAPRMTFERVEARARWRQEETGWRLDAPHLRLGKADAPQVLDGLAVAGGERFALRAGRIDAGPLVALLALGDRIDPGLRRWLAGARPDAAIRDLTIVRDATGRAHAQADVQSLHFASVGDTPGLDGLAGTLSGDALGFRFVPDPDAVVRFDWPSGFDAPHPVSLRGEVVGWREGAGLQIGTPALRVQGTGYAADVRGGVWFQNDGTRPVLDLAAVLDEAQVTVAPRFWVRHLMPDTAERWLDAALLGGSLRDGRAVLRGDLDDWPFSAQAGGPQRGVFHAQARLHEARIRFHEEWAPLEDLEADVAFINDGFRVQGNGTIAGVPVRDIQARLDHYSDAKLDVRARPAGDAGRVLALLRDSPLREGMEETFDNLSAAGPLAATFALALPLDGSGTPPAVSGEVDLRGATLGDARWQLELQQVQGQARYDRHGFRGEGLTAVRAGRPATLSLRAGRGHVREAASVFEAELDAALSAAELLEQAPRLAWLEPHLAGRSRWQVAVSVPRATQAGPARTRLHLRSDLVGTALDLPEPLHKPARTPLPTTVAVSLPLEEGDVSVTMGERVALRARATPAGTGVRVMLGATSVSQPPPASGLVVGGRAPALDVMAWTGLATGDDGGGEGGLPLRGIDVHVDALQLLGTRFPATRLLAEQDAALTRVRFDGPALAGTLQVPRGPGGAVAGRFDRLHWQPAALLASPAQGAADAGPAPSMPARDDDAAGAAGGTNTADAMDPAKVPPLQLQIDDFRFGALALGRLDLRTRPVAGGLEIEQLQTRSPSQRLDAGGSWIGRGAVERTQLRVDADSRDFGELMAGLGFGSSIDGGTGRLRFQAEWPRGPADFSLGAIRGEVSVSIQDGRLVEIEPGAGRVLGLLGVAQLPRRLLLDFRDFFAKGFAFDRIDGTVDFAAGTARSDDMTIDGPAAEIVMRGRSDLRAQTHDQIIEVHPRTGNLLPAVGALAGGPVGAAMGAVANAMLKRPLGEMNARTYRVSGSWKDPKVEVVEGRREPQAASARSASPAGLR